MRDRSPRVEVHSENTDQRVVPALQRVDPLVDRRDRLRRIGKDWLFGACGDRCERQTVEQSVPPGQSSHRSPGYRSARDAPKRLWQRPFRSLWTQDRGAVGPGQKLVRDGVDLLERDALDPVEGLRNGAVFAVIELAAADTVHPR